MNDENGDLKTQERKRHFELVLVHINYLFYVDDDDDDDNDLDQHSTQEQYSDRTSQTISNEYESQVNDDKAQSDGTSISKSEREAHHQMQHDIFNSIIRTWE